MDISRPGPKRKWTDEQLREAVMTEHSWAAVSRVLGAHYSTARQRALELGLDTSRMEAANHTRPPAVDPETHSVDLERLRHAAESLAKSWYLLHGFTTYHPDVDSGVDLLVENGAISRVQIKSVSTKRGGRWQAQIRRPGDRSTYAPTMVDEFFIVTGTGEMYRIPMAAVGGMTALVLDIKYEKYRVTLF